MLRTIFVALVLAVPGLASAQEQFPQSALHAEIRGHDGRVLSRVTAVERNADGEVVAIEAPGLEPADAPYVGDELVAEADYQRVSLAVRRGEDEPRGAANRRVLR